MWRAGCMSICIQQARALVHINYHSYCTSQYLHVSDWSTYAWRTHAGQACVTLMPSRQVLFYFEWELYMPRRSLFPRDSMRGHYTRPRLSFKLSLCPARWTTGFCCVQTTRGCPASVHVPSLSTLRSAIIARTASFLTKGL